MSRRLLIGVGCVLVAAALWLTLRLSHGPVTPLAAPVPNPIGTPARTTALDPPAKPVSTTSASLQPAGAAAPTDSPATRDETAQTIVLYGYVRAAEGAPPPTEPPSVSLVDDKGERVRAEASSEGAYSISGLLPGKYHLTASSSPNSTAEANLELVPAETPKRFDIVLIAKSSLLVRVVDHDGLPLTKGWLGAVATREAPGEWVDETPNQDLFGVGRFHDNGLDGSTMAEGCLGRLDLEVAPPIFVSLLHNQRVIATQRAEAGQQEVVFVVDADSPLLATATVRVRFVDQAGQEVPKLFATLNGGSSTRTARPDAGAFVWAALQPGWYRVQVYAQGFEQPVIECRVEPGESKDLGTVTLAPEEWISGTIVESQKTTERIDLRCDPYDPSADSMTTLYRYKSISTYATNPDGTFRISSRGRGLYLLKYSGRESSYGIWARIVDTRAGPVENVQVNLVPGIPVMVRPSGDDWRSITFQITDDSGARFVASRLWSSNSQKVLLSPGHYKVVARQGSAEPTTQMIVVVRDGFELRVP